MIHYHGTPISGKATDAIEVLSGRHALVSFMHPQHLNLVMDVCKSFIIDNGAFSLWKKSDTNVDFEAYAEWVGRIHKHPGFDWCLIPDVIAGSEKTNYDLVQRWVNEVPHIRGTPVWHFHESLEWLDLLADQFEWVALGSSAQWSHVGSKIWWERMSEVMNVCCDSEGKPRCRLHGLRMLDPRVFSKLPLSGADSTNAARNCRSLDRFGMYVPPTKGQRAIVIANRVESHNSAHVWVRK